MARNLYAIGLAVLAFAGTVCSQALPPPPPPKAQAPAGPVEESDLVIRTEVSLVNVMATVTTKKNALVANLKQEDFKLYEDGKERPIRYFEVERNLPLTIGMLIDESGSMASLIPEERRAGSIFFENVLRQQDLAFLIGFGKDAELLQDSTNSPRILQRGLDDLRQNSSVSLGGGPVPTANNQAGTVLYDAVYLAADERLKQETGRKVIILITDGMDEGSRISRDKAIQAAQEADAIIYGIYYQAGYYGDKGTLNRMAEETGGRVFDVGRGGNLERIFKEIEDELRSQYAISFEPAKSEKDGSYHKLELKVANKDYKVRARKGYYAVDSDR